MQQDIGWTTIKTKTNSIMFSLIIFSYRGLSKPALLKSSIIMQKEQKMKRNGTKINFSMRANKE